MSVVQISSPDTSVVGETVPVYFSLPRILWEGMYDQLQIWSAPVRGGPYTEVTKDGWQPARLPVTASKVQAVSSTKTALLNGLNLKVLIDERFQVDVQFSGTDPILLSSAASQVVEQSAGLLNAYVDENQQLVLETTGIGRERILRILECDAAPVLNLPYAGADYYSYGADRHPTLTEAVTYVDSHGKSTGYYRYRYVNSQTLAVSTFAASIPATSFSKLSPSSLCTGTLRLVDAGGLPVANRLVEIVLLEQGALIDGANVVRSYLSAPTDTDGRVSFVLARGIKIGVSISDTLIARELTVPVDPTITSFGLLSAGLGADDLFDVQTPSVVFMQRRSL